MSFSFYICWDLCGNMGTVTFLGGAAYGFGFGVGAAAGIGLSGSTDTCLREGVYMQWTAQFSHGIAGGSVSGNTATVKSPWNYSPDVKIPNSWSGGFGPGGGWAVTSEACVTLLFKKAKCPCPLRDEEPSENGKIYGCVTTSCDCWCIKPDNSRFRIVGKKRTDNKGQCQILCHRENPDNDWECQRSLSPDR